MKTSMTANLLSDPGSKDLKTLDSSDVELVPLRYEIVRTRQDIGG